MASTPKVEYADASASLVEMYRPGTTSNTSIFQPGGGGIGSLRIAESLDRLDGTSEPARGVSLR
jgi:hypothetical protein